MLKSVDPWPDFQALCGFGGRLCGTPSEAEARAYLSRRLQALASDHGGRSTSIRLDYGGWRARTGRIEAAGEAFDGYPLLHTPATGADGLTAQVVDLGRGAEADFEARSEEIPGRMVLVRHEFMFGTGHIHRNRKYEWAVANGAAGFLIAGGAGQTGPVGGGVGFKDADVPIPAMGISAAAAGALAGADGADASVRLVIETETGPAETETLIYERPGETSEWVVLSAHIDGHGLAQSAIDNASGLAAALAATAAVAAAGSLRRGLRLCLFSIEEWGLLASQRYVSELDDAARAAIVLNVNLDSVAGADALAALYSGYPALGAFLGEVAQSADIPLSLHEPLVRNSDHYNFAVAGIPACRLMAGFEMPDSNMRHVLTAEDAIDKVTPAQMAMAAELTARIVRRAATAETLSLRSDEPTPLR
jgi:Zn-dependent M28 family amino/carboxypeptidase